MKYIIIIILAALSLIVSSCGKKKAEGTLAELQKSKIEFETKIKSYSDSLNIIKDKIKDLNKDNLVSAKVRVDSIKRIPFSEIIKLQGTVEADKNVLVSPQASGMIKGIFVKEGQRVSAGATLATIDSDIIYQNIKELQKALELANYMFEKQTKLKAQGVGTDVQYEQSKNQKESLESKLRTLRTQAGKSRVISPISGYVDQILPNVGEMASPQMPMFRVLNLNKLTVSVDVSESYIQNIQKGKPVSVYFPSINTKIDDLKISRTSKFINPANRTYTVQIDLNNKNGQIPLNLLAEVSITKSYTDNAIIVPSKSVFEDNKGNKYVYLMVNNKAVKRDIKIDFVDGNNTQINAESSIKEGDLIIVDGGSVLIDGDFVEIL